jgi:hypothetical protein
MRRASFVLALGVAAVAATGACAQRHEMVGTVTTLSPQLCIGRHAGTGDCFTGASDAALSQLHVGECVVVSFAPSAGSGAARVETVQPIPAAEHPRDCATS